MCHWFKEVHKKLETVVDLCAKRNTETNGRSQIKNERVGKIMKDIGGREGNENE